MAIPQLAQNKNGKNRQRWSNQIATSGRCWQSPAKPCMEKKTSVFRKTRQAEVNTAGALCDQCGVTGRKGAGLDRTVTVTDDSFDLTCSNPSIASSSK